MIYFYHVALAVFVNGRRDWENKWFAVIFDIDFIYSYGTLIWLFDKLNLYFYMNLLNQNVQSDFICNHARRLRLHWTPCSSVMDQNLSCEKQSGSDCCSNGNQFVREFWQFWKLNYDGEMLLINLKFQTRRNWFIIFLGRIMNCGAMAEN